MKEALTAGIAHEVSDILLAPMSETLYDNLKKAILDRTQPTTAERMSQLLAQQPVVDGRPTQPVRLMQQAPGDDPLEGDFWKQFFIKRLPAKIQPVLAPKFPVSLLEILAKMADMIVDATRTAQI